MTYVDWLGRAAGLAAALTQDGVLRDPLLRVGVQQVPRHVLVPRFYEQHAPQMDWQEVRGDNPAQRERWLETVYSNKPLITSLADNGDGNPVAASSSSQPSLMIRMLEALEIRTGHRVLEIGTGTGYNAALLCHRLGDNLVFSVDIDVELVVLARKRLAGLGYRLQTAGVDGIGGLPVHAPYDRIISTCSVPWVPWAWAEQTCEGGLVLTDLKIGTNAGNLVLLRRLPDRLEGRFLPKWAGFMRMRHDADCQQRTYPRRVRGEASSRTTSVAPQPWDNLVVWFLAQLHQPADMTFGFNLDEQTRRPTATFLAAPDGSWCEIDHTEQDGRYQVVEAGPQQLWTAIEQAHDLWEAVGRPGWDRLGHTVTEQNHSVWLDHPEAGEHRWELPAARPDP